MTGDEDHFYSGRKFFCLLEDVDAGNIRKEQVGDNDVKLLVFQVLYGFLARAAATDPGIQRRKDVRVWRKERRNAASSTESRTLEPGV